MHNAPKNYAEYHKEIEGSLQDQFLRKTLDSFAIAYRENRERIFKDVDEHALIHAIADMKDDACKHMEELYAQFKAQAEKRGVHVHRAATAEEANAIIAASRENMLGASLYMCCTDPRTGAVMPSTNSCMMCKKLIINAGISTVYIRDTALEFREIPVTDWITDDDSLSGALGY